MEEEKRPSKMRRQRNRILLTRIKSQAQKMSGNCDECGQSMRPKTPNLNNRLKSLIEYNNRVVNLDPNLVSTLDLMFKPAKYPEFTRKFPIIRTHKIITDSFYWHEESQIIKKPRIFTKLKKWLISLFSA
jgi:hypothetical protein